MTKIAAETWSVPAKFLVHRVGNRSCVLVTKTVTLNRAVTKCNPDFFDHQSQIFRLKICFCNFHLKIANFSITSRKFFSKKFFEKKADRQEVFFEISKISKNSITKRKIGKNFENWKFSKLLADLLFEKSRILRLVIEFLKIVHTNVYYDALKWRWNSTRIGQKTV